MNITRFEVDFVERTKKIMAAYEGEYKLTNLLNCMVGLVILPIERAQDDCPALWEREIKEIPIFSDLKIHIFNPIQKIDKTTRTPTYFPKTLRIFLKKLRNGIAHQNIEPINENNLFVGVIIRNKFRNVVDFELEFKRPELEKFAIFIADQYLHHVR